jgi:sporulation protein YlmC with PRC-barrel domain
MKDVITGDDILGKEALDSDGSILGIVEKLHISNKKKEIVGITVDMGFMKPDLFIGINNIRHFGIDAVLLNKVPVHKFKGLLVLGPEGEEIGRVKEVALRGKKIKEIILSGKKKPFEKGKRYISASDIDKIGASVILKKGYKIKEE